MTQQPVVADSSRASTLSVQVLNRDDNAWVILRGEADIATLGDLEAALTHVELHDRKPVNLDVTELTFADVATVRRLALFAHQARQAGHSVRTCGATPALRKVADILGFHTDLGLL